MPATDRLLRERDFHDRQARDRATTFAARPDRLRFRDADYFDHEWANEEWSRGGMMGHAGPGVLTQYGYMLRRPAGRIQRHGAPRPPRASHTRPAAESSSSKGTTSNR